MPNEDNATHKDEHQGNIIIDLDDLEHSDSYEADELLFNGECDKWEKKIRESLTDNIGDRNSSPQKKKHIHQQTYYIGGGRGSGKSTFLHAITNKLVDESAGRDKKAAIIRKIAIIDPTKLGAGEDFFIHILSCFSSIIHNNNDPADDTQLYKQKQITDRREIMQCIQTIVEGVKNIANKNRSTLDSIDDAWFIQNSMQNSASSSHLREQFSDLIWLTCQYLSCDALIIGIDDADINSAKSREVLEYMRKYMLNSRLIFIFAGDIPLQEQMIRCMQFENFSEKALKYDLKEENVRLNLINQMQEQYMLKLFPISNRYNIPNLTKELLKNIKLVSGGETIADSCYDFVKSKLKENVGSAELLLTALLQTPKRTFFQLMQSWCSGNQIAEGLRQIATYTIAKYKIKDREIASESIRALSEGVISAVSQDEDMVSKAALYPSIDDEMNRAYLYLSAEVHRTTKLCSKKLEYMLMTFPYLQILSRLREILAKSGASKEITNSNETFFKRYLSNSLDGDYRLWGRRVTASLAVIAKSGTNTSAKNVQYKQYGYGCIRIMRRPHGAGWKRLDGIEKQILKCANSVATDEEKSAALFYLSLKNSISGIAIGSSHALCISIFNILGLIMQCISVLVNSAKDDNSDYHPVHAASVKTDEEIIKNLVDIICPKADYFIENSPYSQYIFKEEENDTTSTDENDDHKEDYITKDNQYNQVSKLARFAAEKILKWWIDHKNDSSATFAPSYSLCWKSFISATIWKTDDIALKGPSANNKQAHYVGDTLKVYMEAFISAIQNNFTESFASFISDFPLWKPFAPDESCDQLYERYREILNKLYAGQTGKPKSDSSIQLTQKMRKNSK